jgi:hypothetical protein
MQGANGSYVGHMHRSSSAAFIWLMFALILAAQGASPALLNAAILKSFADLDAAAQSSPLLLVLFDPFSPRSSSDSHLPGIQCSTKCRELLLLCEGAAALRLPKRSRITCGLAQGDREWMKGCVCLPVPRLFVLMLNHQALPQCPGCAILSSIPSGFCRVIKKCVPCSRRAVPQLFGHCKLLPVRARRAAKAGRH